MVPFEVPGFRMHRRQGNSPLVALEKNWPGQKCPLPWSWYSISGTWVLAPKALRLCFTCTVIVDELAGPSQALVESS